MKGTVRHSYWQLKQHSNTRIYVILMNNCERKIGILQEKKKKNEKLSFICCYNSRFKTNKKKKNETQILEIRLFLFVLVTNLSEWQLFRIGATLAYALLNDTHCEATMSNASLRLAGINIIS